ncbi:hypothetical protein EBI_26771 [Enterocytozoon bieneusi H348]|nr:hypothetical protein EBI_26771 [Enterocytozoon bieneusi H348]|eukprot:XP_002650832.1 hypothetical protein EBI_26771 [Enterocytozoon bieneusi H348]
MDQGHDVLKCHVPAGARGFQLGEIDELLEHDPVLVTQVRQGFGDVAHEQLWRAATEQQMRGQWGTLQQRLAQEGFKIAAHQCTVVTPVVIGIDGQPADQVALCAGLFVQAQNQRAEQQCLSTLLWRCTVQCRIGPDDEGGQALDQ